MIFVKKYIPIFLSLMLLVYYVVLSWVFHRSGYEHSEALFLAEKIKLLFQTKDNILLILGTTFPSIVFLSSAAFSFFGYPYAPILASACFTTVLFYLLLKDFTRSNFQRRFFLPMICLLFIFHPGLVFAGTSGRGVAAVLLFFYLVFRSLFLYYKTQTTFSLSMASIYLTILVFCNYNFIWLLLAFLPFMVLVALDGIKKQNKFASSFDHYAEAINNKSQARKLANRTWGIYMILFLLPLGALFLFKMLNYFHAGDSTYFLTSQYANWKVTGTEFVGNIIKAGGENTNIICQNHLVLQVYVLLLTPLMLVVFIIYKGKIFELLTLFVPFVFISIVLLTNEVYLTVEYYLIFLILALVGIYYYAGKKYKTRAIYPIIMLVAIANIYTGVLYFKRSSDKEEISFFNAMKSASKWRGERKLSEEIQMANYISNLATKENKILMDDAAAYPIVAHLKTLDPIILPVNIQFITAIENPRAGAKYVCVAKQSNRLSGFTLLNQYGLNKLSNRQNFIPTIMFETENWAVYRIKDEG